MFPNHFIIVTHTPQKSITFDRHYFTFFRRFLTLR